MVEVFKTDIGCEKKAREVCQRITSELHYQTVSIDLDDCDKILRIESEIIQVSLVAKVLLRHNVQHELL